MTELYRFESLHSRDVQEGDSREVQDQAVDVHPGNADLRRRVSPVDLDRTTLEVSGQVQIVRLIRPQPFLFDKCRRLKAFLG